MKIAWQENALAYSAASGFKRLRSATAPATAGRQLPGAGRLTVMKVKLAAAFVALACELVAVDVAKADTTVSQYTAVGLTDYNVSSNAGQIQTDDGIGNIAISGATYANGAATFAFVTAQGGYGSASSSLKYYFEISGPDAEVQLDISGRLGVFNSGGLFPSQSYIEVGSDALTAAASDMFFKGAECHAVSCDIVSGSETNGMTTETVSAWSGNAVADINLNGMFATNTLYFIQLSSAVTGAFGSGHGPIFSYSFADPIISIDPSSPDAGLYGISMMDNVPNELGPYGPDFPQVDAGVPEPGAWAMMVVGLGGMGALLRRARRIGAIAA